MNELRAIVNGLYIVMGPVTVRCQKRSSDGSGAGPLEQIADYYLDRGAASLSSASDRQ